MFNKLKQYRDLRHQAKTLQSALSTESVTVEKGGLSVVMNGNMEIIKITLSDGMDKVSQESLLIECLNDAIKKTQRLMARKMQEMGGLQGLL